MTVPYLTYVWKARGFMIVKFHVEQFLHEEPKEISLKAKLRAKKSLESKIMTYVQIEYFKTS